MYSTGFEEVEKKTTERWEENADMNLNFVSPCVVVRANT